MRPGTSESEHFLSYPEFWPFYLREHANSKTRLWHIAGTLVASALFVAAILALSPTLLAAALIVGYGPAWIVHFLVEKNRPATFRYPMWSLASDLRMAGLWLTGCLARELKKAGIEP